MWTTSKLQALTKCYKMCSKKVLFYGHNPKTTNQGEKQTLETNAQQTDRDRGEKGLKTLGRGK